MTAPTTQVPLPLHLQHKPVFAVPFFDHDPGHEGDTDCQHLSVGWSQWDNKEVSAKAIRHSGQKWSRQAEELPPARLADLLSLVMMTVLAGDEDTITVPANFFENQPQPMTIRRHGGSDAERELYRRALTDNEVFGRRLDRLTDLLIERRQRLAAP